MNNHARLHLEKAVFALAGTYDDVPFRPYTTEISDDNLRLYTEATVGTKKISASSIAGVAGSLLKPTANITGLTSIERGWGEQRMRFLLHVSVDSGLGSDTLYCLSGYTDHVGISRSDHIDTNMRIYFNNTVMLNRVTDYRAANAPVRWRMAEASHILTANDYAPDHRSQFAEDERSYLRPSDLLAVLQADVYNVDPTGDTRALVNLHGPAKSNRSNGNAANYLTRAVNALADAETMTGDPLRTDDIDVYSEARGLAREAYSTDDPVLTVICHSTTYVEDGYITYGELRRLFPNIDSVRTMPQYGALEEVGMARRGRGESLTGASSETQVAAILANSVPAALMASMLTTIVVMFTNDTDDGIPDIEVKNASSFSTDVGVRPLVEQFILRLRTEIIPAVTHRNKVLVDVAMSCNIMGETRITVSYNLGPNYDYIIPTFCDSIFTPVVSNVCSLIGNLASDLSVISNTTGSAYGTKSRSRDHYSRHSVNDRPVDTRSTSGIVLADDLRSLNQQENRHETRRSSRRV